MDSNSTAWRRWCSALAFMAAGILAHAADHPRPVSPHQSKAGPVATVNGQPISRALHDELLKAQVGVPNPYNEDTPEDAEERRRAMLATDRAGLMDKLIVMEALAQKAQERGLHLRADIAAEAELQYKTLLQQHLVRQLIDEITIEPAEIAARYAAQKPDQEYKVSHILLKDGVAAKAVIDDIEKGASFEKLARRHSMDKQSKKDGSLGWLMLNQMVEPFAEAAAALEIGGYTRKPIETSYGWHVIRVDGKRDLRKPVFDDMRDILRTQILQEKVQDRVRQFMQNTKIEIIQHE
ncbi:MAG: hypothetical protein A3I66_18115 [Burkholderiales bacterium RIFCSPLOWO2_02_FULL_57_36]|nr:MAG: hypothetical protein A3I66_18115 [Burkholderiales bacterium RIFCSPLOWO2_02_FULL_57_36]